MATMKARYTSSTSARRRRLNAARPSMAIIMEKDAIIMASMIIMKAVLLSEGRHAELASAWAEAKLVFWFWLQRSKRNIWLYLLLARSLAFYGVIISPVSLTVNGLI